MNRHQKAQKTGPLPGQDLPWYKQFWPWFIIALPTSAVIASFFSLWLAISNPDQLVVDEDEYQQLSSELKAQLPVKKEQKSDTGVSDSRSN